MRVRWWMLCGGLGWLLGCRAPMLDSPSLADSRPVSAPAAQSLTTINGPAAPGAPARATLSDEAKLAAKSGIVTAATSSAAADQSPVSPALVSPALMSHATSSAARGTVRDEWVAPASSVSGVREGVVRAAVVSQPASGDSEELPAPAAKKPAATHEPLAPGGSKRPVLKLDPAAQGQPLDPLTLREVSESVYVAYPVLEALRLEFEIAEGKEISSWGEFDLKIKGESLAGPMGYYQNYRNLLRLEQNVFRNGSTVFGQYRLGDGNFPPWYGERETNEGGEFKAGFLLPLLRDRRIDQRRADIFQATLRRQQVDPMVRSALLDFNQSAADAYWSWVAAGLAYDVQADLLRVTVERNRIYEERVEAKDLARIELVQNERLIASREAKVIEAERKLQQSALKLSLYVRDQEGQPILPSPALLPPDFPEPTPYDPERNDAAVAAALGARPELVELDYAREQAEIDLAAGQNLRLPGVAAVFDASKDMGQPASKKGDKTPFELEAGVLVDVPLQRRKAAGKIREAEGKLAQIAVKRRFTENKIEVEVRDALSALITSYGRVLRARDGVSLARQLQQAERDRFEEQESDLLRVAIQETAAIEAAVTEIEALADYFKAQAALRAAMGADPLADEAP